jgi:uncharacterized protein
MKLLVVLLALLAGVWLWQRGRRLKDHRDTTPRANNPARALPMVSCARCGVHVPGHEAVVGRHGSYCTLTHRRESEGE